VLNLNNLLALTLTALVGIFSVLYLNAENARQADQIDRLEREAKADQQLIADQAKALAGQQALQVELGKISAATRKTEQTLSRQSEQLARDLEELKRTDETVEPTPRNNRPHRLPSSRWRANWCRAGCRHVRPWSRMKTPWRR